MSHTPCTCFCSGQRVARHAGRGASAGDSVLSAVWTLKSSWLDCQVTLGSTRLYLCGIRCDQSGRFIRGAAACRCAQLELQDCTLRELCLSIRRDGEPLDATFVCRIGEITVRSSKMAAWPFFKCFSSPLSLPACRRGRCGSSRGGRWGLVRLRRGVAARCRHLRRVHVPVPAL